MLSNHSVLAKMIGLPPIFWHEHGIGGGVLQVISQCLYLSIRFYVLTMLFVS